MSQGSASDKTGDMSDFIGSNNQYKGIITLLEVLKKMDEQGIMPPGASSQAPRPRRDLPPNSTQIPPNYTRRNQSGDSDRRSQRGRVNRSGFRKRTREGRYLSDISLDEVLQYVHLPSSEASKCLGLGLTSFKRVCRSVGIMSWPYKAGKQPSREELIAMALESGSKESPVKAENPAILAPEAEASLKQLMAFCTGEFRDYLIYKLRSYLEHSCSMKYDCGFTIFNDPMLMTLISKLSK